MRIAARQAILFYALLAAFTLQTVLIQGHVHFATNGLPGFNTEFDSGSKNASGPHQNNNLPANDDPANCPICQAVALAGHYVTPAAIYLAVPAASISPSAIAAIPPFIRARVSHAWRGRAPPQS